MHDIEFDREEIEKVFPNYSFIRRLGKGAYGKVYLVENK